jgi:hypothetical protein
MIEIGKSTIFSIVDSDYPGNRQMVASITIKPYSTIIKESPITFYFDPIDQSNKEYPHWFNNKFTQHKKIFDKHLPNYLLKLLFNFLLHHSCDEISSLLKDDCSLKATRLTNFEDKLIILKQLLDHVDKSIDIPLQKLVHLYDIFLTNSFKITSTNQITGLALFEKVSSINHSCDPNAFWSIQWNWKSDKGPSIIIYSIREINKGEPITISYGPFAFLSSRTQRSKSLGFHCFCQMCTTNEFLLFHEKKDNCFTSCYTSVETLKRIIKSKEEPVSSSSLIKMINQFKLMFKNNCNSVTYHTWNTFLTLLFILGVNFRASKLPPPNKYYLIHYEPYLRDFNKNQTKIIQTTSLFINP